MNKEKITKGLCIVAIIILVVAGISKIVSSNSMTLEEFAAQRAAQEQTND